MKQEILDLLRQHQDLLAAEKQVVARWLCEEWNLGTATAPKWLQRRCWQLFSFPLDLADSPEKMARDLTIELLSVHKKEILARARANKALNATGGRGRPPAR
jgi:hypothetical protein